MSDKPRFFLAQDQSCHWHIVDASKRTEWEAWNTLDEDDENGWVTPLFAKMLGGNPSRVEFENPTET